MRARERLQKRKIAKRRVPEKQWEMPAGFHANGKTLATLKDVVDPHKPTMQLTNLPFDKRAALDQLGSEVIIQNGSGTQRCKQPNGTRQCPMFDKSGNPVLDSQGKPPV